MKTLIIVLLLFLSICALSLKGNELVIIDNTDLPTANNIDVSKSEAIAKGMVDDPVKEDL
jgi:hypothetical protein